MKLNTGMSRLADNIDAYMARDPAARSRLMVALTYPGFHATLCHGFSSWLWRRRLPVAARWVAGIARWLTGVEIHPAARLGARLVIDHGMGVVIGETAEVGDDVTLYHGVTLGGIAPSVDSGSQKGVKRHPTIGPGAIIGAGAQILGPVTVGAGARVGANAVAVRDVPPGVTVVGIPARQTADPREAGRPCFPAYGTPRDLSDPTAKALGRALAEIGRLQDRVAALENAAHAPADASAASGDDPAPAAAAARGRIADSARQARPARRAP